MIYPLLFLLGFVSLGFQVILLRELLVILSGNELIIGIFLANWMLVVAAGSFVGGTMSRRLGKSKKLLEIPILLTGLIMPLEILFIRVLRQHMQKIPTEILSLAPAEIFSLLSVILVCFLFGFWFVAAVKIFSENRAGEKDIVGRLYAIETFGAVLGGLLVSIFFIKYSNAVQISIFFSLLIFATLVFFFSRKYIILLVLFAVFMYKSPSIEKWSVAYQWRPFDVVESKDSAYGKITVLKSGNEYNFFENSNRIYSTIPQSKSEEITNIPLLLAPGAKNVLLLGGGGNDIYEVLKYPVERVLYVDYNPVFLHFLEKYSSETIRRALRSPRTEVLNEDGRFFVKKTKEQFDCIIVDVPPPLTGIANRYFTTEFFSEIKNILSENGLLIFPLMSSENYMSDEMKYLSSSVFETAKSVFGYCYVIPGDENYYVCATHKLEIGPAGLIRRIKEQKIKTKYLTPYYLNYILRNDRTERVKDWIAEKSGRVLKNSDFHPICYFYGLDYWLSFFGGTVPERLFARPALAAMSVVFMFVYAAILIFFARVRKFVYESTVWVASMASIILELLIIFAFQSVYGYVYYKIGLLLALCLLGVGAGSYLSELYLTKKENPLTIIRILIYGMTVFSLSLPVIFKTLSANPTLAEPVFYVLIIITGLFIGVVFPIAVKQGSKTSESRVGRYYGLDLMGGVFGLVLASLIFIPLLGLANACFFTAAIIFLLTFFVVYI